MSYDNDQRFRLWVVQIYFLIGVKDNRQVQLTRKVYLSRKYTHYIHFNYDFLTLFYQNLTNFLLLRIIGGASQPPKPPPVATPLIVLAAFPLRHSSSLSILNSGVKSDLSTQLVKAAFHC